MRHNLSMSPYFRKGGRAGRGAGHLWTLADVEGRCRTRRCHTAERMGRLPPAAAAGFTGDPVSDRGRRAVIWEGTRDHIVRICDCRLVKV